MHPDDHNKVINEFLGNLIRQYLSLLMLLNVVYIFQELKWL